MKKADIIKTIQQEEARLFLELKKSEQLFGVGSPLHKISRSEWSAIYTLMETLNIKPDITLLDAQNAFEIINELRMVEKFELDDFDSRDVLP